jgi:hypothetical protein
MRLLHLLESEVNMLWLQESQHIHLLILYCLYDWQYKNFPRTSGTV